MSRCIARVRVGRAAGDRLLPLYEDEDGQEVAEDLASYLELEEEVLGDMLKAGEVDNPPVRDATVYLPDGAVTVPFDWVERWLINRDRERHRGYARARAFDRRLQSACGVDEWGCPLEDEYGDPIDAEDSGDEP